MNRLDNANYLEFFPQNLKKYKNLKALAISFKNSFKEDITKNITKLAFFYNFENLDEKLIDEFAWGFNIEEYKDSLDKATKIKLIKAAYWAHSKKGTKNAVVRALKNLNYEVSVQEWFEYGGNPFTYRIITENLNKETNWLREVIDLVDKNKNTRSILDAAYTVQRKNKEICIGAYKQISIINKKNNSSKDREINKKVYFGVYRTIRKERTINEI